MQYTSLKSNWLETNEYPLFDILLSDPILKMFESEGFSDELKFNIDCATGYYIDTDNPNYDADDDERTRNLQRILSDCQTYCTEQLGLELIDLTAGYEPWFDLCLHIEAKWHAPEISPINYFEPEDGSVSALISYLQRVNCDMSFLPSQLENIEYLEANPVLASIGQMLNDNLCTSTGLNHYAASNLEHHGFKHVVVERDGGCPVRCKVVTRKGELYYG